MARSYTGLDFLRSWTISYEETQLKFANKLYGAIASSITLNELSEEKLFNKHKSSSSNHKHSSNEILIKHL